MKKYLIFLLFLFSYVHADTWYDTVKNGHDDGMVYNGALDDNDNANYMAIAAGYGDTNFVRFLTCPIPAGATITVCSLGFQSNEASTGACSTLVRAEDTADATTFSTYLDYRARLMTTANDSIAFPGATANVRYWVEVNPAILQEVIDRADWAVDNDISFHFFALAIGVNGRKYLAFDYTTTLCPIIRVYYTVAETSTRPVRYKHGPGGAALTQSISGKSTVHEP